MMVTWVLQKLLWAFRYPSSTGELVGEYSVGAIQTRIPGAIACQIHYPTLETSSSSSSSSATTPPPPYWRPEAVKGLANYNRQTPDNLEFLLNRPHPCLWEAPPISDRQFPIVVFSHGLSGSLEMYTQLCQQVASQGFWVIAVEHEDGSGAYAYDEATKLPIYYQRPDDTPYSRTKVVTFRRPFLQQRVAELGRVLEYVCGKQTATTTTATTRDAASDDDDNNNNNNNSLLFQVFQAADASQGIHLLGHSFGGATMISALQDKSFRRQHPIIQSLTTLDCWAFCLDDQALKQGIASSCSSSSNNNNNNGSSGQSVRYLSILSEAWLTNPETAQVKELLQHSSSAVDNENDNNDKVDVKSFYVAESVHASFSDATNWLPGWVGRKMGLRGANESTHATIRTAARACAAHLQSAPVDASVIEGLEEFPIESNAAVTASSSPAVEAVVVE